MSIRQQVTYIQIRTPQLALEGYKNILECICIIEQEIKQIEHDMEVIIWM